MAPARTADAPELQFRLVEAFVDLVEDMLRSASPAVLVLDDLHWADEGTLVALRHIGRRLRASPLLVIGAYRPRPTTGALDRTISSLRTGGAVSDLTRTARCQCGRRPRRGSCTARRPVTRCSMRWTVPRATRSSSSSWPGPRWQRAPSSGRRPRRVAFVWSAADVSCAHPAPHCRIFPADAVDVLRVAAVLGSSFSVADLCIVLDRRAVQLLGPLEHCVDDGLLRDDGDALVFRHDLIRDAIRQDLSGDLERELHRDIGRALATAEGPTLRAAHHLVRGARPRRRRRRQLALRGGPTRRRPPTPVLALGLLDRALDLSQPDDPARVAILIERARALLWAGRLTEGRELAERLFGAGGGPDVAALHETLATAFFLEGRLAEVVDRSTGPRRTLRSRCRGEHFAEPRPRSATSSPAISSGAVAQAEEARDVGSELGDDGAQCLALCTLALVAHIGGDATHALELAEQAVLLFGTEGFTGGALRAALLPRAHPAEHRSRGRRGQGIRHRSAPV